MLIKTLSMNGEPETITDWTMEEILNEINRDHSDDWTPYDENDWEEGWTPYDENDWEEGWNEWVEGEFYQLVPTDLVNVNALITK